MKKERDDVYDLPGEVWMNIMARLPVRIIFRIKLVCREWKSITESALFRDLYQSHEWSMLHGEQRVGGGGDSRLDELKLDDLPHDHGSLSFASFLNIQHKKIITEIRVEACSDGLVLLRLKSDEDTMKRYYVGNPVLPQWIQLPPPSPPPFSCEYVGNDFTDSGLVTQMHKGALKAYKVVRMHITHTHAQGSWLFDVFSSDTGEWSVEKVACPTGVHRLIFNTSNPVSLNGKLHWFYCTRGHGIHNSVVVRDFFFRDQFQVVSLPPHTRRHECRREFCCPSPGGKMVLTTSQGYCMLIDVEMFRVSYHVKLWRLSTESWSWEKAWEIDMACTGLATNCVPMAINYFNIHIIYLWDLDQKCFLACNIRTYTKAYGIPKAGAIRKRRFSRLIKDGALSYEEDTFSFEARSCLTQFVPSLQPVPTLI